MRDRRYEQGGVVSFVIVAVFLAALLGAGIWWAKKMQIPAATTNSGSTSSNTVTGGSGSPQTGQNEKTDGVSGGTGSSGASNGSGGTSTAPGGSTTAPGSTSTDTVAPTGPSVSEVPNTGPSEVLATGAFLSAGSALMYYVVQARRRVRTSALK